MRINSRFPSRLARCLLPGFIFLFLTYPIPMGRAYGQEATIADFTVSNSESHLLLYLSVADWFTDDMEAAIQNGIPITFAFSIVFAVDRPRWPDKKMKEYEFNHVMEYDSLKKEYHIHRDEKGDSRITTSLEEARRLMSEINGFRVLPLDELTPWVSYKLRAKTRLARKTLPLSFHYLIPFSSPWDFQTEWHELTLRLAL